MYLVVNMVDGTRKERGPNRKILYIFSETFCRPVSGEKDELVIKRFC